MSTARVDIAAGAAMRRRQRRLRSWLKQERMTVVMALAEASHHSAPRVQRTARAGVWGRELNFTATIRDPSPAGALQPRRRARQGAPDRLPVVSGPQERTKRRTVDQMVDANVLRFFDTLCPVAEQVIDVPKIILEDIPARRLCREPQLVEQLVEVPTIISFSSLQRIVEQNVAIPVLGGGGPSSGLQGFSSGQCSTAPQFSEERISERIVEQIVDTPSGGLQGLRPVQGTQASSSSSVSRSPTTFSPPKSAKVTGTRVRECLGAPTHPS